VGIWWVVCLCALGATQQARISVEREGMIGLESFVMEGLLDLIASMAHTIGGERPFLASSGDTLVCCLH